MSATPKFTRAEVERIVADVLPRHSTLKDAAEELGCYRSTLNNTLERYGLGNASEYLMPPASPVPLDRPTLPSMQDPRHAMVPPDTEYPAEIASSGTIRPSAPLTLNPQPEYMERIMTISDPHRPYHDRKAWATAMQIARWYKPHILAEAVNRMAESAITPLLFFH